MTNDSTSKRIAVVVEMVRRHYEQGRQDRCLRWVWEHHVYPELGISIRTFRRYLSEAGVRVISPPRHKPRTRMSYAERLADAERRQLRIELWD